MFLVYVVSCFIVSVVSTSAISCLERLIFEMTCYVSIEWGVKPYTLTYHDHPGLCHHFVYISRKTR